MTDYELDFLIADAMTKVDALLTRGAHYNNIAIVVTPFVYCRIARRSDYERAGNIRIDGSGYYGRYHGFNIYIVENGAEQDMCFPALCYEANDILIPIHPGEYLIFGNNEEVYQTETDGVTIRDSGMRVAREVQRHATTSAATTAASDVFAAHLDSVISDELMRALRNPFGGEMYATASSMSSWVRDVVGTPFKKPVAKAKRAQVEPELQPTPELDEFIEQFRRSS